MIQGGRKFDKSDHMLLSLAVEHRTITGVKNCYRVQFQTSLATPSESKDCSNETQIAPEPNIPTPRQTDMASSHLNGWPGHLDGPTSFVFSLHCVSQHFLWDGPTTTQATEGTFSFATGGRAVTNVAVPDPKAGSHLCLCP